MRKEDGLEVEDDDVLQELLSKSGDKELCLVAKKNSQTLKIKQNVKISTLNQKEPSSFDANSLKLLKIHGTFSDSFLFIFKRHCLRNRSDSKKSTVSDRPLMFFF